jgi:hypothetical protein
MFLVPTYLSRSNTHGFGVFTPHHLAQGTVLWEFTPDVDLRITPETLEGVPHPLRDKLRTYSYREPDGTYVLCGDNAKFMNHAFDPNCHDIEGPYTVARRDIAAGEELTCDYRVFDLDSAVDGLEAWRT